MSESQPKYFLNEQISERLEALDNEVAAIKATVIKLNDSLVKVEKDLQALKIAKQATPAGAKPAMYETPKKPERVYDDLG